MFFSAPPRLIIGDNSALYVSKTHRVLLQNPQEISTLGTEALEIFVDFPGAHYTTHKYPKLSRFEQKQAIQNHPDLHNKNLLSASAFITKKGRLSLCTLQNTPILTPWLEALSSHGIPVKSLKSLAFTEGLTIENKTKATYWISQTQDQRARHICLIKGTIVFVRYTKLTKSINSEIKKTLQFIQRDYALDRSDITLQNDLNKKRDPTLQRPSKILHWDWLHRLPHPLSKSFKNLYRQQRLKQATAFARMASLTLLVLSSGLFLKSTLSYCIAYNTHQDILQSHQDLSPSLRDVELEKLQHILWVVHHSQSPFKIIHILQQQGNTPFKLEEFHWQVTEGNTQRLRLAIKHHEQHRQQESAEKLKSLFKTSPIFLSSDKIVDRFELILATGDKND